MFSAARTVSKIATDCGREGHQLGHTFSVPVCSARPRGGGQTPAHTLPRGGPRGGCAGRRGGGQELGRPVARVQVSGAGWAGFSPERSCSPHQTSPWGRGDTPRLGGFQGPGVRVFSAS